jgi:CRISPR/Cas system-associated exonuclease Cas4 (RecB family)
VYDPAFIEVLRDLGGYTEVLRQCSAELLQAQAANPRLAHAQDAIQRWLSDRLPQLRERVQLLIGRLRLQTGAADWSHSPSAGQRHALGFGSYPEVQLRLPALGWGGVADLLNLSSDVYEIVDFKTGAPHPEHEFQLRVYSLLWARDSDLNPTGRLADKLTLAYPDQDQAVPAPAEVELTTLERELAERTRAAIDSVRHHPPAAKPSWAVCRSCSVRQLCAEYWQPSVQRQLAEQAVADRGDRAVPVVDAQAYIKGALGPASWEAVIAVSGAWPLNTRVTLLAAGAPAQTLRSLLRPGSSVRIIDGYVKHEVSPATEPVVLEIRATSEVFVVTGPE